MASKRLNERLAKYNYLYEGDSTARPLADADVTDSSDCKISAQQQKQTSDNNNVVEPERIPVKKLMESVSANSKAEHTNGLSNGRVSPGLRESEKSSALSNGDHHNVKLLTNGGTGTLENNTSSDHISKREAFFKGENGGGKYEAPSTKFDPALRERDGKAEKIEKSSPIPTTKSEKMDEPEVNPENKENVKPSSIRSEPSKSLEGYVGFANLPNQVYRKAVKRGFEFTLMLVGESGLGKSTMINSLFLTDLYSDQYPGPSHRTQKTAKIQSNQVLLKESGVQLKLTVVDTPGFGDAVNNTDCWQPLTSFIDNKYEEYLNAESKVDRKTAPDDNRVHCCLYFIAPTGHSLKPLDIEVMKRLHDKVNIIPLIAKADSLTPEECRDFKKNILNEIHRNKIRIYEFPDVDDEEENRELGKLKERVPFAVVGSNRVLEVNGRKLRARDYPWGTVEVDNLEHNDFIGLRDMLIRTHMQDLKDVTNNVHYENFRYSKLADVSTTDGKVSDGSRDPLTQMEEQKREHKLKMKKMEAEMEQVFEMKVKEKTQKLKDSEYDLQRRAEQMKKSLEQQENELAEKRRQFEEEKSLWEKQHKFSDQDVSSLKGKKKGIFN